MSFDYKTLAGVLALGAAVGGCSLIGDSVPINEVVPHGGTGEFRALDRDETGIRGSVPGQALVLSGIAFDSGMVAGEHLFFASAFGLDAPPEVPEDHPNTQVYWPAFEGRAIRRAPAREEDEGFQGGVTVLEAERPWEGESVFHPWVLVEEDRTLLYYAAAEGIGVATSGAVDGSFSRVGEGPILDMAASQTGIPSRPSVVRLGDGTYSMYYDCGGGVIGLAQSDDGLAFTQVGPISLELFEGETDQIESAQVAVSQPGALVVSTGVEREIIRLYFVSLREDGTEYVYVAGSEDGTTFIQHPRPSGHGPGLSFPAPLQIDQRVTMLYANAPLFARGFQTRAFVASVAPGTVSFFEEPVEEEE